MFIEKFNNNGTECLRLCRSYKPAGSSRSQREIIYYIGPLSRYSDGKPDYLDRLRESYKEGHPLIAELQAYVETDDQKPEKPEMVMLPFPVKGEDPNGEFITKWFADLILNAYMKELGLAQLFRTIKSRSRIRFDLLGFVKLIVYGRILAPASKAATIEQNDAYYTPILDKGFNPYKIYDTLDIVYENRLRIFQTIDKALQSRKGGRDTSIVFYDVTNFFFEIELNDEDLRDSDGVVIEEGLRKRGHSKESRPQPIVQMGLFMDRDGVPIGIKAFPGNTVDKVTMTRATSEIITPMGYERYIYCADRGLCTLANLAFLVKEGMGYLLSKSIKQSKKEDRDWIIDPKGYIEQKDAKGEVIFKYKDTTLERTYTDEDGNTVTFKEKVVVFWSREYYRREQHMMESFSSFLEKLENTARSFTLSAGQIRKVRKFLKDEVLESLDPENDISEGREDSVQKTSSAAESENSSSENGKGIADVSISDKAESSNSKTGSDSTSEAAAKSTGKSGRHRLTQEEKDQRAAQKKAEAARVKALKQAREKRLAEQMKDSFTARTMIDWDKVNRWRDYAGYYQIVTSELEMKDLDVINTYRGLTQIENRFRTMKGTLYARPIYLRDPDHISGHLVLCTVALIIIALIQCKVKVKESDEDSEEETQEQKWELGMDPDRIQDALNALQVEPFPNDYFRFRSRTDNKAGTDLQRILDAHDVSLESHLYTPGALRSLRGSIKVL